MDEKKTELVERAMMAIQKEHGRGSIMKLGDRPNLKIESMSSGCIAIDLALGIMGFPKGRVTEIYGPESSGKTTVALHIIAEAQKSGSIAAFVDAEHALDPTYAAALGVDIEELLISQPDSGEQALSIVETLVESGGVDVIVIDSVAALVPKAELEGDMGDAHVGLQARLMSQAMRKLTGAISKSNCIVIFINQIREKVGVMFGNPETTPGGRALKFYASVRCEVRSIATIKDGSSQVGRRTRMNVVKNKVAPPFKVCEFDIVWGQGIDNVGSLLDLAVEQEPPIVIKSGAWFSYKGEKLGQGRASAIETLKSNSKFLESLQKEIMDLHASDKLRLKSGNRSGNDE